MLLAWTLERALEDLGDGSWVFEESVVPAQLTCAPHNPYRPGYEWLFTCERRLARFLDPWLKAKRHSLIGTRGLLNEALSNAFCHGHGRDPRQAIAVRINLGREGLLIRIEDGGPGFAVDEVYARLKRGRPYYHIAGNGLQRMAASTEFAIFHSDGGKAFNLVYRFDEKYSPDASAPRPES